ncbi:MAG: hypothetical protein P8X50_07170 [Maritimibacter sp.]
MIAHPKLPLTLSGLAALLTLGAALTGIIQPSIYQPMTPDNLMPGTLSQDIISLAVSLALLACLRPLARSTSLRLWLIWLGLMGYLAYAYGIYVFETVINPLYLIYIAIFSLSIWAVISFFARADLAVNAPDAPRRITAALFALLVAMFLMLWLSILIPAMQNQSAPVGATIFAFDLALILPLLSFAALMLWRGQHWGDVLALPLLVKAATLGLSVLIGTLIGPLWGLPLAIDEVGIYAVLTLLPAALIIPWYRNVNA